MVADNPNCPPPPMPKAAYVGLRPRFMVDADRIIEILEACMRYAEGGKQIPSAWVDELNEINSRIGVDLAIKTGAL